MWEKITPDRCKLLQQTYQFVFYVKIMAHHGFTIKTLFAR